MQAYQNTVLDTAGNAVSGVSVTVKLAGTSTLASIFSDNVNTVLANPFTNATDGSFKFYAANGRYDVTLSKTGYAAAAVDTSDILVYDFVGSPSTALAAGYVKSSGTVLTSQALPILTADLGSGTANTSTFLRGDSSWQVPAGIAGAISVAGTLVGSASGTDYTTTSATFADVDATNLKATVTVPTGAKFIIVTASLVGFGGAITDGLAHIQVLAAGTAVALSHFFNNGTISPSPGPMTTFGVVSNPTAGSQTIALQFKGDGTNACTIRNRAVDGVLAANDFAQRARLLYIVTT